MKNLVIVLAVISAVAVGVSQMRSTKSKAASVPSESASTSGSTSGEAIVKAGGPVASGVAGSSQKPQAPIKVPNVEIKATPIDDYKVVWNRLSNQELKQIAKTVDARIAKSNIVKKANTVGITPKEASWLANELNRRAAAKIILIERMLAHLESNKR